LESKLAVVEIRTKMVAWLKKHKPRRCERRRAIFTALNGDAEAVTWPLDKKPWAYFW